MASMHSPKVAKLLALVPVKLKARVRLCSANSAELNEVQSVEFELGTQGQTDEHMFWEVSPPIVPSTPSIILRTCLMMKP